MSDTKTNVTRNTSYIAAAMVMQKILSLTYFTILARELGPENLGKYYFAISFTTIFSIIVDLGLANVLTREIAKDRPQAKKLLGTVMALKLPLAVFSFLLVYLASGWFGHDQLVKNLILVSIGCVILDSFSASFFAVSRGFQNLKYEAIFAAIFHVIVIAVGLPLLFSGASLTLQMGALFMASLCQCIYSLVVVAGKIGIPIIPVYDKKLIKEILLVALPFALYVVFQRVYTYLDSVLLEHFAGAIYVGYYQISFRIVFALQFIPSALAASAYPAMSSYWVSNREQLKTTFEKSLIYLTLAALPISAGVIAMADEIILLFKSGYEEAVLPMRIIILAVFFIFVNFPIGSLLNACDRQKTNTRNIAIVTLISVALNLLLIPHFKAVGASMTVLATNAIMTVLGLTLAAKIIPLNFGKLSIAGLKIILSSVIMGVSVWLLKDIVGVFVVIPIGALIYIASILILRTISKDEMAHLFNSILKR
jgi:O-antigen/teichoic acid export membrane protein